MRIARLGKLPVDCSAGFLDLTQVNPKRILIVEDDVLMAHKMRIALTVDGHTVETAGDGEEGLSKFAAGQYDVVICDFQLPKMDGMELAEVMRQHNPAQRIILITAYAEKLDSSMGQVSNVDLLLRKPLTVDDMERALRQLFPEP